MVKKRILLVNIYILLDSRLSMPDHEMLVNSNGFHHRHGNSMKQIVRMLLLSGLSLCIAAAAMTEVEKIQALLETLERSNLVFIRNGAEYSSRKARAHLEMKLSRAGSRVKTARQFIDLLATRSYTSNKLYYVKFPDGRVRGAGEWLSEKLAEIERRSP